MTIKPLRTIPLAALILVACVGCSSNGANALTGRDASCSTAGVKAQPDLERAITSLQGAGAPVWHNASCTATDGTKDVPSAVLEVPFAGTPAAVGDQLRAAGCTLKKNKKATWTCRLNEITYELAAHEADTGTKTLTSVTDA